MLINMNFLEHDLPKSFSGLRKNHSHSDSSKCGIDFLIYFTS